MKSCGHFTTRVKSTPSIEPEKSHNNSLDTTDICAYQFSPMFAARMFFRLLFAVIYIGIIYLTYNLISHFLYDGDFSVRTIHTKEYCKTLIEWILQTYDDFQLSKDLEEKDKKQNDLVDQINENSLLYAYGRNMTRKLMADMNKSMLTFNRKLEFDTEDELYEMEDPLEDS